MNYSLKELYEVLDKVRELNDIDDYNYNEANDDDEHEYICCDQKIIHYVDDCYDISCLYNQHPTYKFDTIEEVVSFFEGCWESFLIFKDNDSKANTAFNLGLYTEKINLLIFWFNRDIEKYKEFLFEKQYDWNAEGKSPTYPLDLDNLPKLFKY